jgi:soluble lytic murein transglycosylase-like protein
MTYISTLRRHTVAALLIAAILTVAPATISGAAVPRDRFQVPAKICNIDWRKGRWQVKQLIRCAATYWHVPGGAETALAIADRESRFRPRAYNSSGCAGIYQHMLRYWPGRASDYGFPGWSAFNARANIIVTIRMVKRAGWGPWT